MEKGLNNKVQEEHEFQNRSYIFYLSLGSILFILGIIIIPYLRSVSYLLIIMGFLIIIVSFILSKMKIIINFNSIGFKTIIKSKLSSQILFLNIKGFEIVKKYYTPYNTDKTGYTLKVRLYLKDGSTVFKRISDYKGLNGTPDNNKLVNIIKSKGIEQY